MNSIFFQIISLVYVLLLTLVYFPKKKINNVENKIYGWLIITNIFGLILDVASVYTIMYMESFPILNGVITKLYLMYLLTWISLLTLYMKAISNNSNKGKKKYLKLLIIYIVSLLFIIILPLYYFKNGAIYSYGPSANYLYFISVLYMGLWLFYISKNINNIKNKKYLPMLVYMSIGVLVIIIQKLNPQLLLMTSMETFVTFLMYFTIENPDLTMIEQLRQNKRLIEKGNEDKSNFLFRMSQEVRKPIDDIIRVNNIITNTDEKETIDKCIKYIDYNAKQLKVLVNDVLDISKMDTYNIKMIESTYNVYNVFAEITSRFDSMKNDKVELRYSISKNIPKILYGDAVKIKQVVTTVLQNAVDYTKVGYIDMNVDSIVKNDVCRLIITIEDSGIGMSLDKINELLSLESNIQEEDIKKLESMNLDLNIALKITRLLGGQILIKSEENKGSEFIIVIEQKIKKNDNEVVKKEQIEEYSKTFLGKKRVLVVTDKKETLINITSCLKNYNIDIFTSMYGSDCIDRIKHGKKYDLIMLEDEMQPKTGINTLQELKLINKFKTPVVVMLDKNKEAIKEHYVNDGFKDYILKENLVNEVDKIMKKYV